MRLLIGIMLSLTIVGIAASVQSGNSTGKSIIQGDIAKNVTIKMNNSINQTNITNKINSSNRTNISVIRRSVLGSNGINSSTMATPSKAAFESEPVSFRANATDQSGEGSTMATPSKAAFESEPVSFRANATDQSGEGSTMETPAHASFDSYVI